MAAVSLGAYFQSSGLIDEQGYFHGTTRAFREQARRDAVRAEMVAQIDRAVQLGLAPTHLDTHMLAALHKPFADDYLRIGCDRGLPSFLPRRHDHRGQRQLLQAGEDTWEQCGTPVFDCYKVATQRRHVTDQDSFVRELFSQLPAGLSCVLLRPAIDTEEVRRVTDQWKGRVADFEAFRQPSLRDHIRQLGIQLISYAPLRDAMRSRLL